MVWPWSSWTVTASARLDEDPVQARARGAEVGDEAGVGEHERDAPGEDLEEREVVGVEAGAGAGQAEHADPCARRSAAAPRRGRRRRAGGPRRPPAARAPPRRARAGAAACRRARSGPPSSRRRPRGSARPRRRRRRPRRARRRRGCRRAASTVIRARCSAARSSAQAASMARMPPAATIVIRTQWSVDAGVVVPPAARDRERERDAADRRGRAGVPATASANGASTKVVVKTTSSAGGDVDDGQRRVAARARAPTSARHPGGARRSGRQGAPDRDQPPPRDPNRDAQRAASPSSRSTRIVSFHSPSRRPWRRCTPTSVNPAARCSARLAWLVVKTRLVSL